MRRAAWKEKLQFYNWRRRARVSRAPTTAGLVTVNTTAGLVTVNTTAGLVTVNTKTQGQQEGLLLGAELGGEVLFEGGYDAIGKVFELLLG